MNLFEKMIREFGATSQAGCVIGKPWHLSFIRPFEWTDPDAMEFNRETVTVSMEGKDYRVTVEYAVLMIERPWFHMNLFSIPFKHLNFDRGKISDGTGNGFLPVINTGMIVTRKIEIEGCYENNKYQIVGWVVRKLPLCPSAG